MQYVSGLIAAAASNCAAAAEQERRYISRRTKEALAAAKARGLQLGDPEIGQRSRVALDAHAESLRPIVTPLGGRTTRAIAKVLNDRGIPTPRGGSWQFPQADEPSRALNFAH